MNRVAGIVALLVAALPGAAGRAWAQPMPARPLFADRAPLELRITAPFRALERDDAEERPEHDAVVEFTGADGGLAGIDIEIRIRGNSRLRVCSFPPLSLDFPRSRVEGTLFEGQDRLKLVTLCQRTDDYRDYLALEYLIYRLFNELTERSFRVRWAEVEYVYSDTPRPRSITEPAFLIESDEEVADRLGLEIVEEERLDIGALDGAHTALLALFQYMIGNTDWEGIDGPDGEACCHNGDVVAARGEPFVLLPYDFDQAGLIDTEYAIPNERLPIRSVTQRYYRGFCAHNPGLTAAVARINARRGAMESVFAEGIAGVRAARQGLEYLETSFELLNEPRRFEAGIIDDCRE